MEWILANWLSLLAAIFAFGLVVFVHESGHFMIARAVGVRVHEFSLGFGPQIWKRQSGETEYSVRAVPLGGFVRLEGEDSADVQPDDPGNFQNKTTFQKFAVIVGGCLMNYSCAFLVYLLVGMMHGMPAMEQAADAGTTIGLVMGGMPAAAAGVQVGDKVTAVDGQPVKTWKDMTEKISSHPGVPLKVTLQRAGKDVDVTVTPTAEGGKDEDGQPLDKGKIGVGADQSTQQIVFVGTAGFREVASSYWVMAYRLTAAPVELVSQLVRGKKKVAEARKEMGGPLKIGSMFLDAAAAGFWSLLFLWAVISTLVGGFNLLPIPALDGARAFILLIGAIRRKPIDQEKEALVHTVGLAVLLTLVVILTFQDIGNLKNGFHMFR